MSRISRILVVTMLVASPVGAQQTQPAAKPVEARTEQEKEAAAKLLTEAAATAARVAAEGGQAVNVRVELTITDQRGDQPAITKTVTMVAADRSYTRIRTQGDVRTPTGFRPVILNVDARPTLYKSPNREAVRLELTIEYRPVAAEAESEKSTTPNINESLAVVLEDGKPMLLSQSADPVTDRKVKVEAKATILR